MLRYKIMVPPERMQSPANPDRQQQQQHASRQQAQQQGSTCGSSSNINKWPLGIEENSKLVFGDAIWPWLPKQGAIVVTLVRILLAMMPHPIFCPCKPFMRLDTSLTTPWVLGIGPGLGLTVLKAESVGEC